MGNFRYLTIIATVAVLAGLSGCAGYGVKGDALTQSLQSGNISAGVSELEGTDPNATRDLLYYLEKGELLRAAGNYQDSLSTWLSAEEKVEAWEDLVKNDPSKLMGDLGSIIANDSTRRYDGRDYEKVLLNVRLALDHIGLNEWDNARTQIKKMHEREAIIAEFRANEVEQAKEKASAKGVKVTSFKELNGYPIETLEAPEVVELKNSYESAFANYLAGFIYESLGEPSLAAPGYRRAAELRPNNPAIEQALAELDARIQQSQKKAGPQKKKSVKKKPEEPVEVPKKTVDTLIVIESGMAPAIRSQQIPLNLPIPTQNGIDFVMVAISWPVIYPENSSIVPGEVLIDNSSNIPVAMLANTNAMARKAISDEMPGIIARSTIRAIAKGAAQKAVDNNASKMGAFGLLASLATKVASVASEQADERTWRTLPGFFSIARTSLEPGKHVMTIQTSSGPKTFEFSVGGTHALVGVRMVNDNIYLAQPLGVETDIKSGMVTNKPLPAAADDSTANVAEK